MKMHCDSASRAGGSPSLDRVLKGRDFVIVMDGASPFRPTPVDGSTYVDTLGEVLARLLSRRYAPLADMVHDAISDTAHRLGLVKGSSPSAALAVIRVGGTDLETFVLGDCLVATPDGDELTDNRLSSMAIDIRQEYKSRLQAGHGYDEVHRRLLRKLQEEEAEYRNVPGGYWIAEANPKAAYQAIERCYPADAVPWCVLATDGAYRPLRQLGIPWNRVHENLENLEQLLADCQQLEELDPEGLRWPRAKRHDDKTLAVVSLSSDLCQSHDACVQTFFT